MSLESLFLPDFNVFFHSPDHLEGKDSLAAVIARFQDPICANVRSHLTALTSLSRAQEGTSGGLTAVVKGDDAGDSPGWAPASRAVSEYGGESATSYALVGLKCLKHVLLRRPRPSTSPWCTILVSSMSTTANARFSRIRVRHATARIPSRGSGVSATFVALWAAGPRAPGLSQ